MFGLLAHEKKVTQVSQIKKKKNKKNYHEHEYECNFVV